MTRIARYIIVLDRYDDDDYLQAETDGTGLNDGTESGGCAQVAAELQEAMAQVGEPAGFFNVIAREVFDDPEPHVNVSQQSLGELRAQTILMLGRWRPQTIAAERTETGNAG